MKGRSVCAANRVPVGNSAFRTEYGQGPHEPAGKCEPLCSDETDALICKHCDCLYFENRDEPVPPKVNP